MRLFLFAVVVMACFLAAIVTTSRTATGNSCCDYCTPAMAPVEHCTDPRLLVVVAPAATSVLTGGSISSVVAIFRRIGVLTVSQYSCAPLALAGAGCTATPLMAATAAALPSYNLLCRLRQPSSPRALAPKSRFRAAQFSRFNTAKNRVANRRALGREAHIWTDQPSYVKLLVHGMGKSGVRQQFRRVPLRSRRLCS